MKEGKKTATKTDRAGLDVFQKIVDELKELSATRGTLALGFVLEDDELMKLLIAWPRIEMRIEEVGDPPSQESFLEGEREAVLDRWTWDQVKPDYPKLARLTGEESAIGSRKLAERGRSLGLIYPDGTVNATLIGILMSKAHGALIFPRPLKVHGEEEEGVDW